jgi:hypothetical protein
MGFMGIWHLPGVHTGAARCDAHEACYVFCIVYCYSVLFIVYCVFCIVYCVLVYCVLFIVYCVLWIVYCVFCISV